MFKQRFTAYEIFQVFVVCSFTVHVWSVYNLLKEAPAWMLRMSAGELTATIAYVLAFTLFESVVVCLGIVLLGVLLPSRWLRSKLATLASVVLYLAILGSGVAYKLGARPETWAGKEFVFAGSLFVAASAAAYLFVLRFPGLERKILAIVDRVSVLTLAYVFFDLIAVLVVIIRNV